MVRDRIQPVPLLMLTAVWILLWGNISWANVLGGLAIACLVLLVFPLPRLVTGVRVRPWPLLVLVARFHRDLFVATWQVAAAAVLRGPQTTGRIIAVQLRARDQLLQTITAEMVALVPGTVVIDLDSADRTLLVHALDVDTEAEVEAVRRQIHEQEERVLRALASDPTCGEGARS